MPLIDGLICANGSLVKDDTIYEVSVFYINLEHKKTCSKAGFNIWSKMYYPKMVGLERLELSHLAAPEPKSGASTNSATAPFLLLYHQKQLNSNAIKIVN